MDTFSSLLHRAPPLMAATHMMLPTAIPLGPPPSSAATMMPTTTSAAVAAVAAAVAAATAASASGNKLVRPPKSPKRPDPVLDRSRGSKGSVKAVYKGAWSIEVRSEPSLPNEQEGRDTRCADGQSVDDGRKTIWFAPSWACMAPRNGR